MRQVVVYNQAWDLNEHLAHVGIGVLGAILCRKYCAQRRAASKRVVGLSRRDGYGYVPSSPQYSSPARKGGRQLMQVVVKGE